jgi:hypothetical protein
MHFKVPSYNRRVANGLQSAIEGLYETFSAYPLRNYTDPCTHCHQNPDEEKRLHAKPLRQFTHSDLARYASDALYTWGDENDFRHFLPRLFELVFEAEFNDIIFEDPESLFRRLDYATWSSWPVAEQQAVREFFSQSFQRILSIDPEHDSWSVAYEWLIAIAQAEPDLSAYLSLWLGTTHRGGIRNLAIAISAHDLLANEPSEAYWDGFGARWQQVSQWVRSAPVLDKLEEAYKLSEDETLSAELEAALVGLR